LYRRDAARSEAKSAAYLLAETCATLEDRRNMFRTTYMSGATSAAKLSCALTGLDDVILPCLDGVAA
jgi:hypothetical protein